MSDEKKHEEHAKSKADQKKLDDILKQQAKHSAPKRSEAPAPHTPTPSSTGGLEKTIFERFLGGMFDGVKTVTTPIYTAAWMAGGAAASVSYAGVGPLILSTGLATGRYFINKKIGKSYNFMDFKKEFAKGLFSGTLFFPIAKDIAATTDIAARIGKSLFMGAPTFIAGDKFLDHYMETYQTPSNVLKAVNEQGLVKVISGGVGHTLREVPKGYVSWFKDTYGILPAIVTTNWVSDFSLPVKYGISVGTSSAYRYYTSPERKAMAKGKANGASSDNSLAAPAHLQYSPQQQALNQYLAQNPQIASQMANQYRQAA